MPQRSSGYFGGSKKGESSSQHDEDPALMTQSSKIVYIQTEDLDPLDNPQAEFKKCINTKNGIYS